MGARLSRPGASQYDTGSREIKQFLPKVRPAAQKGNFITVLSLELAGDWSEVDTTRQVQSKTSTNDFTVQEGRTVKRNILLVGTSGRGKSATGNSLLGGQVFNTSDSAETDPDSIVCASKEVDGLELTVCDALTIQDIRMTQKEAQKDIKERLEKCFDACPDGFHFIIFVFSYVNRVTPEENNAAEILTKLFGGQFFIHQGISVFTHGENFDLQRKESRGPGFDKWYRNAKDPLLQNISNNMKAFMIYNVHSRKMAGQRQEILKIVRNCNMCVRREQHGYMVVDSESNYSENTRQQQSNMLSSGTTNLPDGQNDYMDTEVQSINVPETRHTSHGAQVTRCHKVRPLLEGSSREGETRRQSRAHHRYSAVDGQHRNYPYARRQRNSEPQPLSFKQKSSSDGEIAKAKWSDVSEYPTDDTGKHATKKTWNMILVYGSDGGGKATRNVLIGPKKDRHSVTIKKSKKGLSTVCFKTNFENTSFNVMDGQNLLSTKRIDKKRLLLDDSFEHFPHGFHALVLVLSKKAKLTKKEINAVNDLRKILGEQFIENHCILLYPKVKKLSQQGKVKKLIEDCKARAVPFDMSSSEKKESFIKDLILSMKKIQMPFNGPALPEEFISCVQAPGSRGLRHQTTGDDRFPTAYRMRDTKYQQSVSTKL